MTEKQKTEIVDEDEIDISQLDKLIPALNVNVPKEVVEADQDRDISYLVPDEKLTGLFDELLQTIKNDREEIDEVMVKFLDFIINSGDTSNSTKESFVALAKIKSDTVDKAIKIADLMTRIKMKKRDTFKPFPNLTANQTNNISVESSTVKNRALLEQIETLKKKHK